MPQVFQVLKCYKCSVFQVHQTKKSNKWECKLCGEKQSIKRHYGLGTGKECRLHVQKLNGIRSELDELNESIQLNTTDDEQHNIKYEQHENVSRKPSKWTNFIDVEENSETYDEHNMYIGNTEVVLEVPKKKKKFNVPKIVKETRNYDIKSNKCQEKILKANNSNYNSFNELSASTKTSTSHVLEKYLNNSDVKEIKKDKAIDIVYKPPVVNQNSKWAEFIDQNETTLPKEENNVRINSNLFSLCDDSDLDNVLAL